MVSDSFEDAKIYHTYEEKSDDNKLYAYWYKKASPGVKAEYPKVPLDDIKGTLFPSFFYPRKANVEDLEDYAKLYKEVGDHVEAYLLSKKGYSALISEVVTYCVSQGISKDNAENVIKVLISELLVYSYKKLKSGEFIEFSDLKTNSEKSKQYYGSLAAEIKVKSDQISLMIPHGQTVGNYRELLLRNLLKKYVPEKFKVATGFIEGLSRQIDIIIYDSLNYSPSFIEGELVVIRREAVRGIIEVKSVLASANLQEALEFFYDLTRGGIFKPNPPIFKGIFAFDSLYASTISLAEAVKNFYTEPVFVDSLQEYMTRDVQYLFHEITCISVLNQHCVFSKYVHANGNEKDNIIPVLYSLADNRQLDVQTAMFIATLFDFLDVDYPAKYYTQSSFANLYQSKTALVELETKLTSDDWIPRMANSNEHNFTQEGIKLHLKRVEEWFNGTLSTRDLTQNPDKKTL